jgi:hypothetical protein
MYLVMGGLDDAHLSFSQGFGDEPPNGNDGN